MAADKKTTVGVLWNVNEGRVESYHESEKAAKDAAKKFAEKSGVNQDLLELDTAQFTVRAPKSSAA
jgi:hypothetical protein